ncbi:MAG TPA: NAD(P)/FAD-dependent oxidoreductase [Blastocatellia bacterium]|nr:NAD(P)/FAD-dependent oxidoreductase [Blastocatellia bacterium]
MTRLKLVTDRSAEFAIVGAGPAGAHLAARLASLGRTVALFDPKGAWEKPCGGGITSRGLKEYPFLLEKTSDQYNRVQTLDIISSRGRSVSVKLKYPFVVYSRRVLNGLLLQKALDAGAYFIHDAVKDLSTEDGGWSVTCRDGQRWRASYLVGADGAASFTRRRLLGIFPAKDLALAVGYNLALAGDSLPRGGPASSSQAISEADFGRLSAKAVVRFAKGFRGYFWAFPRTTEINFGAACRLGERTGEQLRTLLAEFMGETLAGANPDSPGLSFFAAKIPILDRNTWPNLRASGDGWALIGDAAGFVDPLTGEGIYFALRSADLLFQSLTNPGKPLLHQDECDESGSVSGQSKVSSGTGRYDGVAETYETSWRSEFGVELQRASQLLDRFYDSRFCGMAFDDAMVKLARLHRGIRRVMVRCVVGEQNYTTLKADLVRSLPNIFGRG